MNRFRIIGYYLLIAGLCLSGPALLIAWTWWIEPNWGTVEVVRAVKNVERGERLSGQQLRLDKVRKDALVQGAVTKLTDAVDREVTRSIRIGEQLTPDMLNTKHLLPGKDEWNMSLPTEWIFGKPPGSLLRGDRISLLLISKEEAKRLDERASESVSREQLDALQIPYEEERKLQHIVVSYAKGTNNQEIAGSEDRKKPTGAVATVELIVSEEQKELIRRYGMKGYRFLIVYR
ncbi:SAF domain-containing protein [Paenibacillus sp. GD4]|jgi:hypothetical protein|uniref:SAF domain-containing protein n=1 Tax=Paenibacillus sp. GD4 TaxID=3068890 RepID=UPI002796C6E9|nr:SAF domain-containing protein [Paenibacillus sp. GD4]MDQ1911851.1 SAF domain-containing protein [Paenibacillus sp. GD4]